jgi:hypothetical protein
MLQWKVLLTLALAVALAASGGDFDWLRTFGW